ncbi:MAG: hypothetical protein N2645_00810 [Clostridia bacterium]|nr:hypothetical protein [Clostridia bacterium]
MRLPNQAKPVLRSNGFTGNSNEALVIAACDPEARGADKGCCFSDGRCRNFRGYHHPHNCRGMFGGASWKRAGGNDCVRL